MDIPEIDFETKADPHSFRVRAFTLAPRVVWVGFLRSSFKYSVKSPFLRCASAAFLPLYKWKTFAKANCYRNIDKLTPKLVRLFIARIEIGEREVKYSRNSVQKIRIVYRDTGDWDYDMTAEEAQPHIAELPPESAEISA